MKPLRHECQPKWMHKSVVAEAWVRMLCWRGTVVSSLDPRASGSTGT